MRSRQRQSAAPYPIFAFPGRECVKIDKNIPFRVLTSKAVERCRPPQSTRMFSILPRIKQLFAAPVRKRNVVWPVENKFERITISSEAAVKEPLHRCGILRLDPGQCLRAFPLFKPEVRIIVRRFDSGSYIDDGHGRLLDWATTQAADSSERVGILILGILGSCFALSLSPYTRNFLLRIHLFSDRQTNDVSRPNSLDQSDGKIRLQN